ncbi:MAG: translation initiation factor IF-2 subunit beta [Candidatus Thermoplasmatota archaeon]|nr:translation initiation factor IF-2 subunit beta [Candidatus Thermoplasmatota archaeon]
MSDEEMAENSKNDSQDPENIFDYEKLLNRAWDSLPDSVKEHSRFSVPNVDALAEGNTTVVRNFADIAGILNRKPSHLLSYLLKELGTAGVLEGRRVVFKGRVPPRQIGQKIESYTKTFVLCSECQRPDTHIVKEGRTQILQCEACGGHRPIKVKKGARKTELNPVREGAEVDVLITDIGKQGDGVAKAGGFTIFVAGVAKGARVKIKIDRVQGRIAFARKVMDI